MALIAESNLTCDVGNGDEPCLVYSFTDLNNNFHKMPIAMSSLPFFSTATGKRFLIAKDPTTVGKDRVRFTGTFFNIQLFTDRNLMLDSSTAGPLNEAWQVNQGSLR